MDLEKLLQELKEELLDKELTLLEMDNKVISIIGDTNSLFKHESDCMEQNSCGYFVEYVEGLGNKEIIVEWEIVKKEESNLDTVVKITNIWDN